MMQQARDLAPGTAERAARKLAGRDGHDRRHALAKAADVKRMHVVPVWAVDPIPCTNHASRPHDNPSVAVDMGIPDDLLWLDRAIAQLARIHRMRALVVREEYTGTGSQSVKARRISEHYGAEFTMRQYRYELDKAKVWLSAYMRVGDEPRYRA